MASADLPSETLQWDDTYKDPKVLQKSIERIDSKLSELSTQNYNVYIRTFQCVQYIASETNTMRKNIRNVSRSLNSIDEVCKRSQSEVIPIVDELEKNINTLEQHQQLLSLLEVPQIIEACVCAGMYEEALELASFTSTLNRSQLLNGKSTSNPIIHSIVSEVRNSCAVLRDKLLEILRGNLQLPICLKVIGVIRGLDSTLLLENQFSQEKYERQLRLEFLNARDVWLSRQARDLRYTDAYNYLVKLIESKRTTWFDMITQYQAIFDTTSSNGESDELLCSWATRHVSEFIRTFTSNLEQVDDCTCIANLLEQCLYFAGALGRIGADFRSTIAVCLENRVVNILSIRWTSALISFSEHLQHQNPSSVSTLPLMVMSLSRQNSSKELSRSSFNGENEMVPPHVIKSFPAVAIFVNNVLESFNELRRCAIVSIQLTLARNLQNCLLALITNLAEFCSQQQLTPLDFVGQYSLSSQKTGQTKTSIPLGAQVCELAKCLAKYVFPFLVKCFRAIYTEQPMLANVLSEEILINELAQNKLYVSLI